MADGNLMVFGKVATEVEIAETKDTKKKMARFSMPFGRAGKDENGNYRKTNTWIRATAFGKTADYIIDKLKKGMNVVVTGKPQFSAYAQKQTGELKVAVNLNISTFNIVYDNAYNDANQSQGEGNYGYEAQPRGMTGQQPNQQETTVF